MKKYETNNIKHYYFVLLPWNGLPFELNEIRHLFNIRGGFVHAPKLWTVYVGGLIWNINIKKIVLTQLGGLIVMVLHL
jgi:hypothetical protein